LIATSTAVPLASTAYSICSAASRAVVRAPMGEGFSLPHRESVRQPGATR
jgi:hypothetical protein